ncbi:MAG: hypothetical protein GY750_12655 [Lentisphaerae bacterium]|nr:hypothetical protein [Lentisphaerota bacterium]MCP4102263.1 hypothetical protein [Lentisphaerota bacterium]
MLNLSRKSCAILTWDQAGNVVGATGIRYGQHQFKLSSVIHRSASEDIPLGQHLSEIYKGYRFESADLILVGGYLPKTVCFELQIAKMPRNELRSALEFEISNRLPVALDDLSWDFRIVRKEQLDNQEDSAQRVVVRISVVFNIARLEIIEKLAANDIHIDALINPLMCIDPLLAENDIELPCAIDDFILKKPSIDGIRHMFPSQSSREDIPLQDTILLYYTDPDLELLKLPEPLQNAALLMLAYGLRCKNEKELTGFASLPEHSRPVRCRWMKRLSFLLGALLIFFCVGYLYKVRSDTSRRLNQVKNEKLSLEDQISKLNFYLRSNAVNEKALYSLANLQRGMASPLKTMALLAGKMPQVMSIYQLRADGCNSDLVLKCPSDKTDINQWLSGLNQLDVSNIRYRRNYDGSRVLYFKLTDQARLPLPEKKIYAGKIK